MGGCILPICKIATVTYDGQLVETELNLVPKPESGLYIVQQVEAVGLVAMIETNGSLANILLRSHEASAD